MTPLKTIRRVLTWFCVCPPEKSDRKSKKCAYVAFTVFALTVHVCSVASDAIFFCEFVSTDVENALMALLQLFGSSTMAYSIVIMFFLRHQINALFETLSEIHNLCKNLLLFFYLVIIFRID